MSERKRMTAWRLELQTLGREIGRRRTELRLTQVELASRSRLSLDGMIRIEMGRTNATVGSLLSIARALNCDVGEFFQKSPKRASPTRRVSALLEGEPEEVITAAAACVRAIVALKAGGAR